MNGDESAQSEDMPEDNAAANAMNAVSSARSRGSNDSAQVTTSPERWTVYALALSGPAISLMIIGGVLIMSYHFWPDVIEAKALPAAERIILAVAAVAVILSMILGVVVFRLAAGSLKRVEAKAGPGSISIETGGDA